MNKPCKIKHNFHHCALKIVSFFFVVSINFLCPINRVFYCNSILCTFYYFKLSLSGPFIVRHHSWNWLSMNKQINYDLISRILGSAVHRNTFDHRSVKTDSLFSCRYFRNVSIASGHTVKVIGVHSNIGPK